MFKYFVSITDARGSVAFSLGLVVECMSRAIAISMSCSSVGFSLARTSVLWSVGCCKEMKRGDMKCTCEYFFKTSFLVMYTGVVVDI